MYALLQSLILLRNELQLVLLRLQAQAGIHQLLLGLVGAGFVLPVPIHLLGKVVDLNSQPVVLLLNFGRLVAGNL